MSDHRTIVQDEMKGFLHRHPFTEMKLGLDSNHCIVDKEHWRIARRKLTRKKLNLLKGFSESKEVEDLEWKEIQSDKVRVFQLEDEPEVFYLIKLREDEYMIVFEDEYDIRTGEIEFVNKQQIYDKYGVDIEGSEYDSVEPEWCEQCSKDCEENGIEYEFNYHFEDGIAYCEHCGRQL